MKIKEMLFGLNVYAALFPQNMENKARIGKLASVEKKKRENIADAIINHWQNLIWYHIK